MSPSTRIEIAMVAPEGSAIDVKALKNFASAIHIRIAFEAAIRVITAIRHVLLRIVGKACASIGL